MSPGLAGETVTFVYFTLGERGELGIQPETPTEVDIEGCRFRPMTAKEVMEAGFEQGLQLWKCTAPAEVNNYPIDDTGYMIVDGVAYAIIGGPRPYTDMEGRMFKVTVYGQKPS